MSDENQTQDTTNQAQVPTTGGSPAVPEYLKSMMGTQTTAADSMASASMSIPRVSMRGKKFRFMNNGEEVHQANDSVNIAVLGVEPGPGRMIKTYYARPYAGVNSNDPPDCASDDGVQPGAWVPNRQAPICQTCPKNMFGSATSRTGKPAKACRDSKRLWIKRAEEAHNPTATIYAMQATVMSLKNLSRYGREMKEKNVPIAAAVTKVIMVDDSEFPMIDFATVGYFKEEVAIGLISEAERAPWKLYTITPQQGAAALPGASGAAQLPGNIHTSAAPAPSAQQTSTEVASQVTRVEPPTTPQPPLTAAESGNVQATPPAGVTGRADVQDIVKNW